LFTIERVIRSRRPAHSFNPQFQKPIPSIAQHASIVQPAPAEAMNASCNSTTE
jgi:hypothetical protein